MKNKIAVYPLDVVNQFAANTILEALDIKITEVTEDHIVGTMPVDKRTHQVHGILHGGASVVLAETLGSIGASLTIDSSKFYCVGLDINANHLKAVKTGLVTGTAKPIHTGRSTQVWQIEIRNDAGEMVCISRLTMAIVPKEK
jgi:1,4-dihydroxy-2-naphthoyl-CoA hydrolase